MCGYCEGEIDNRDNLLMDEDITGAMVYVNGDNFLTLQIEDDCFEIKLNYCPMCGSKLI